MTERTPHNHGHWHVGVTDPSKVTDHDTLACYSSIHEGMARLKNEVGDALALHKHSAREKLRYTTYINRERQTRAHDLQTHQGFTVMVCGSIYWTVWLEDDRDTCDYNKDVENDVRALLDQAQMPPPVAALEA